MEDTNEKEKKGTTVYLNQEAYNLIVNKQTKILNETNKRISIQDLLFQCVKKGIHLINYVNVQENNKDVEI